MDQQPQQSLRRGRGDWLFPMAACVLAYMVLSEAYQIYADWRARRRRLEWDALVRRMTIEPRAEWQEADLKPYNGQDPEKPILLAIDGRVFNVWRGRDFYGKDGPYEVFAGRDATRLLAKGILNEAEDNGQPLTAMEQEVLQGWKEHFTFKYDDCGPLCKG
mmetsp:Transcript_66799/g.159842  ORF Transcript_66799/g.159842 Transcript_66799/m.159842 type:complete len:161 (-) Transcript_66799:249-731(-)|eukprot:CAMPEP_0178422084 /NCGR_PEP_ID=MMETSP0689_2-20121128/26989_1 /TAXON_ID=160604 /ORGANISM="Amphidinium massartii, Strain CS-259" /LENGTH=160 /DNA_ID=CAMNT_0020043633 /DNA_START=27 /DNA_END=509 /DNA_ORIENTATION=-